MEDSNWLALNRPKRHGAGARMNEILNLNHEVDEFYSTKYGGFNDLEDDSDFSSADSSDSENVIDSDFDIEENVEEANSDEEEKKILLEEKREKQRTKATTGYRDPKKSGLKPAAPRISRPVAAKPATRFLVTSHPVSKNLRKSTIRSTRETNDLHDERKRKKKKVFRQQYRKLTQSEMLREAEYTEIENIKSLEAFKNLEIEKTKKTKTNKTLANIPMIKYHSYTEYRSNRPTTRRSENKAHTEDSGTESSEKQARTIITFPSEEIFQRYFSKSTKNDEDLLDKVKATPEKVKSRRMCPITNLPARYVDPLTGVPYASRMAFVMIRHMYVRYLKSSHLQNDSRVKQFVQSYIPFKNVGINVNQVNNLVSNSPGSAPSSS